MKRFDFWQQWLFYSSLLFALAGVIYGLDAGNPVFFTYNKTIAQIFWNAENIPATVEPYRALISASLGGTIACCYILLAFIARYPFRRKEKWSWYAIAFAFAAWVIIDSVICILYGVYFQVYIINAFSILVKALPLIFTRKYFFTS